MQVPPVLSVLALAAVVALAAPAEAPAGDGSDLIRQGEADMKAGRLAEAVEVLRQAVAADPESSLAYTRLGGAQVLTQDHAGAVESFQRAISLNGSNAEAFVGMAVAYIHSGRYPLARAALEEVIRLDPAKQADAERLIAWIDQRASGQGRAH